MFSDQFHLHSNCRLMFRMDPVSKYPHGLKCFGDAKFQGIYGMLLLKSTALIFVPDSDQRTLYLNRSQILKYKVRKKGTSLRISVLYHVFLLSDCTSQFVQHYCFTVKDGKKEDWQL